MNTIDLAALVPPATGSGPGATPLLGSVADFLVDVANANCRGTLLSAQGYTLTRYGDALVPDPYYRSYIPQRVTSPVLRVPSPPGILLPVSRALVYEAVPSKRLGLWAEMLDHLAEGLNLASWPADGSLGLAGSSEAVYEDVGGQSRSAFQCNEIVYRLVLMRP